MKRYIAILLLIVTLFLTACTPNNDETEPTEPTSDNVESSESDQNGAGEKDDGEKEAAKKTYTITYTNSNGGTISGELVQKVVEGKDGTAVRAVPDEGYIFVEWSDGYKSASRIEYKVKANISVHPIFTLEPQDILDAPVITINTEGGAPIEDKENYVTCTIDVSNTDEEACMTEVPAGIRGRGNSSWMWHDKKSYRIKFDKKQSMFGSDYKAKSWTLIANHADRTLSRNALAYELAERFDDIAFSSMHQHVEVYLNGNYLGVYLLCDQMQTGDGRVDIEEDMTGDPDIGYLIEMDQRNDQDGEEGYLYFIGDYDKQYGLKTPDPDDEGYDPEIYLAYIQEYIMNCLDALSNQDWELITSLIDVDSFADAYIVQELFGNIDVGNFSFYMYKPKGDKLYCGPLWDFDLSVGNVNYGYGNEYSWTPEADLNANDGKMLAENDNTWFRRLLRNEEFEAIVKQKLIDYDETIQYVISLADPDNPNGYYQQYQYSMERNFLRWDILGEYVWPNNKAVYSITTVRESFIYVRNWLSDRYLLMQVRFEII